MTFTKIISVFISIVICIVLITLPQVNLSDYSESTISSKFLFFSYSILFLLAPFGLYFIFQTRFKVVLSKIDIVLLSLLGYIILNRYYFQSEYSFSIRFNELLFLSIFYLILRNLNVKSLIWFLIAVVFSGIVQSIDGGLQLLGYVSSNHPGFKMTGSYFNPGPYAWVLAAIWPIALGVYLFKAELISNLQLHFSKHIKPLYKGIHFVLEYLPVICMISIALILPVTQSRAAWLSVIISSIFLLELRYRFLSSRFSKMSSAKVIGLKTLLIVILITLLFSFYNLKKSSSDGRLFIWRVTTSIIKDNPINGVGFDRFKAHYMNYQADFFREKGETTEALVSDNSYYAFNEFLQFITEEGIIGLVLLLLLVYYLFRVKTTNEHFILSRIAFSGLIAIAIFSIFSYPTQILTIKLILIVLLALLAQLDGEKILLLTPPRIKKNHLLVGKLAVFSFILFGVIKGASYTNGLKQAYIDWNSASSAYKYGDFKIAIEKFESAYPVLKKEGDFLMNYGKTLSMAEHNKKAVVILKEAQRYLNTTVIETSLGDSFMGLKKYDEAEQAYEHAHNMIPVRFYPLYLLAKLYEQNGQNNKALEIAEKILKKDIKVPSRAVKEMKEEMEMIVAKAKLLEK